MKPDYQVELHFAAKADSEMDAYWVTSNTFLPTIREFAHAHQIEIKHPFRDDPKMYTGLEGKGEDGTYLIVSNIDFMSSMETWEEITVWLREALDSVHDPAVRFLSLKRYHSFFG